MKYLKLTMTVGLVFTIFIAVFSKNNLPLQTSVNHMIGTTAGGNVLRLCQYSDCLVRMEK